MDCFRQTTTLGWSDVKRTGGKPGNKAGLGCTLYRDNDLRHVSRPQQLSPELNIYGLRATQGYRVFAAYGDHVLYILWFDREHEIAR